MQVSGYYINVHTTANPAGPDPLRVAVRVWHDVAR